MATLLIDHETFEIQLSSVERLLAMREDGIRIPRGAIERVQLTDSAWPWLRGVRSPGSFIPRVLALGTWRTSRAADFVLVRGRRRPTVIFELGDDAEFSRIVLTTRHGLALVDVLGRSGDEQVLQADD